MARAVIKLEYAGGAGYIWQIKETDEYYIIDERFEIKDEASIGGSGIQTFILGSDTVGIKPIKVLYGRPFEPELMEEKEITAEFGTLFFADRL